MAADDLLDALALLGDGLRRRLFDFVRAADRPVTRDDAAAAVSISRNLAAFHLDKLAAAGLLSTTFGAPDGLPRVGRAPKLYQPAERDVHLSIPPRRHDLLAQILVEAVEDGGPSPPTGHAAGRAAASRLGVAVGAAERAASRPGRLGVERALALVARVLERNGFEPLRARQWLLRLRTCPFQPLAQRSPEVVCALNQAFVAGIVDGLGARSVTAELVPGAAGCCIEVGVARR